MSDAKEVKNRYFRNVEGVGYIDIYKILELFGVSSHAVGHAVKKLLMPGQRGSKGYRQDIEEAIASLTRELSLLDERDARQQE